MFLIKEHIYDIINVSDCRPAIKINCKNIEIDIFWSSHCIWLTRTISKHQVKNLTKKEKKNNTYLRHECYSHNGSKIPVTDRYQNISFLVFRQAFDKWERENGKQAKKKTTTNAVVVVVIQNFEMRLPEPQWIF